MYHNNPVMTLVVSNDITTRVIIMALLRGRRVDDRLFNFVDFNLIDGMEQVQVETEARQAGEDWYELLIAVEEEGVDRLLQMADTIKLPTVYVEDSATTGALTTKDLLADIASALAAEEETEIIRHGVGVATGGGSTPCGSMPLTLIGGGAR